MNDEEIQKRIALKMLFAERMQNLTFEEPEQYVSRLVKREVPAVVKKYKSLTEKQIKAGIKKLSKECFKPIVEINEKNLEYSGSKYFGKVWLKNNESWPTNLNGEYLVFILQLDIAKLPKKYKKILGNTGLFQLFFDFEYEGETLMRIVHPDMSGRYHEQPLNKHNSSNYFINDKAPQQKIITSWESYQDLPSYEEILNDKLSELSETLKENDKEDKICAYQGDKLGGYGFWSQAGTSSEDLIFQLDAGSFYDGPAFEAHAPCLFASDGTAHIFYDRENKKFYFDWACG